MNARQKAKKLKKELEVMKRQPLVTEHLKSDITLSLYEVNADKSFIEDEVRLQLANGLAKQIRNKIVISEKEILKGVFPAIKYSTDILVSFEKR